MNSSVDNRIEAQKRKIAVTEDKIARLMSLRVDQEEKLAALYEERNRARSSGDAA